MFRSNQQPNPKKQGAGFYIALAICLTAIGASAWATYDSIQSLRKPASARTTSSAASVAANRPVSGIPAESIAPSSQTPAAASSHPASSAAPVLSEPVSSAPAVSEPPASSEPVSEPPVVSMPEKYMMPINGRILKPFGKSAYSQTFGDWRAHLGVDIAAVKGGNVLAVGRGEVEKFYEDPLLGHVLVIRHGNLEVYYCGLGSNPSVKAGDSVIGGQVLGVVNDIPSETVDEVHLHLQIKKNGEWVEPLAALGKDAPSESGE